MGYVTIPRNHAIKIADLERRSLYERHRLSDPKCKPFWLKAATAADNLVNALKREEDEQAINYMYAVSKWWWPAAKCGPVTKLIKL